MGLVTKYIKFIDVNAGGSVEPPSDGYTVWAKTNVNDSAVSGIVTESSNTSNRLTVTGTTYQSMPQKVTNGRVALTYVESDDSKFEAWYQYSSSTSDTGGIELIPPMGNLYVLDITGDTYLCCNFKTNFSARVYTVFYNTFTDKSMIKYVNTGGAVAVSVDGTKRSSVIINLAESDATLGYVNEIPEFVEFEKWMYTSGLKVLNNATPVAITDFSDVDWQSATNDTLENLPAGSSTILALFKYTPSNVDPTIIPTIVVNVMPVIEEGSIPNKSRGYTVIRNVTGTTDYIMPKPSSSNKVYEMYYSTVNSSVDLTVDAYPALGYVIDKVTINNEPAADLIERSDDSVSDTYETVYSNTYTLNEFSNLRVLFKPTDKMIKVTVFAQYSDEYFKVGAVNSGTIEDINLRNLSVNPYSSNFNGVFTWNGYANSTEFTIKFNSGGEYAIIGYAFKKHDPDGSYTITNYDYKEINASYNDTDSHTLKTTCDRDTDIIIRCSKLKAYRIQGYAYMENGSTLNPALGTITLIGEDGEEDTSAFNTAAVIYLTHDVGSSDYTVTIKATPPDGCKVKEMWYRKPGESTSTKHELNYTLNGNVAVTSLKTSFVDGVSQSNNVWNIRVYFEIVDESKWTKDGKVEVYQIKGKNGTERYEDVYGIYHFIPFTSRFKYSNDNYIAYEYIGPIPKSGMDSELSLFYSDNEKHDAEILGYWVNSTYNEVPQSDPGYIGYEHYTIKITGNTTIKVACEPKDVVDNKIPFTIQAYPVLGEDSLIFSTVGGNILSMTPGTNINNKWYYDSDGTYVNLRFEVYTNSGYELKKWTVNGATQTYSGSLWISSNNGDTLVRCHFVPMAGIEVPYSIVVLPVSYANYRSIEPNTTVGTVTMSQPTPNMTGLSTGMYGRDNIAEGTSTSVNVTASAKSGYTFKGWTINYEGDDVDSNYASTATTFTTTVTNSTVLRAIFKAD